MTSRFCRQCNKRVETYWELESCSKNPDGVIPIPMPHGNKIDGIPTCEDDYCKPDYSVVDLEEITHRYITTHFVKERCSICNQFMECMQ